VKFFNNFISRGGVLTPKHLSIYGVGTQQHRGGIITVYRTSLMSEACVWKHATATFSSTAQHIVSSC